VNPRRVAPYNSPVVKRFNAFSGVFVPTFLTIIGVILFLRTGWVVGQAGLLGALGIVLLANSITLATSSSLSSIATSMRVGTGGAYYLVSRSLGLEAGAAVGLPLYLSQTLSITFYVVGFSEVITSVFPGINGFYLSTAVIGLLALLSFMGADWAIRGQYIILGLIVLGLPGFLLALAAVLPRLPLALVNVPHKEYWFAPERRAASWRYLRTWMVWMVDLSLLFVALLFQAMYQANAQGPEPRLGGLFWFTMGLFLAGTLFLVVLLYRHFRLPAAGEGESSAP